jgi:hypothetical protein
MKLNWPLSCISLLLIIAAAAGWQPSQAFGQAPTSMAPSMAPDLQIVILEGEDGVNVIKKKTAVKPVVEVRDKNKAPGALVMGGIAGAVVLFILPEHGPTGVFANGARWTSVVTDANGRAEASEIRPIGEGSFKVEIRASYQGQNVTRTITQTNFSTIAQAQKAGKVPGSSTHDEEANQNEGQNASQTAGQSAQSGIGATTAAAAAGAAGAGGAAGAAGHTGLIVGAVAAGGAAAGAAAYVVTKKSSTPDCTSQQNQVVSAINNEASVCQSGNLSACTSAAQTALNDLGNWCSCIGGAARISSVQGGQQLLQELEAVASQVGLTIPASCQ